MPFCLSLRKILIIKTILTVFCLLGAVGLLVLKITSGQFFTDVDPLSYTLCGSYLKMKYAHFRIANGIVSGMIIFVCAVEFLLILKFIYELIVKKTERAIEIVDTKLSKLEYMCHSMSTIFYICITVQIVNQKKEVDVCPIDLCENQLIMIIVGASTLLLKIIGFVSYFTLLHSYRKKEVDVSQIEDVREESKQEKQTDFAVKDSKKIRQMLLNQSQNPFNNIDQFTGLQRTQKFSKFIKNQETRTNDRVKNLQTKNVFSQQEGQNQQDLQRLKGLSHQEPPSYDRQKVNEVFKSTIQTLSKYGYDVEDRPYIQKTTLSKKFKVEIQKLHSVDSSQKAKNRKQRNNPTLNGQNQQSQKPELKTNLPAENEQDGQQIQLVVNLDSAEKRIPKNVLKEEDLQTIMLDQIYYRQYINKENAQKEKRNLKLLHLKRVQQIEKEFNESKRMKWVKQEYFEEDKLNTKQYAQMRQYASRTGTIEKFGPEQLLFHLKNGKGQGTLNFNGSNEIAELYKDQIRLPDQDNETKYGKSFRKRLLTKTDSNSVWLKQKRNPLQVIRGRGSQI